MSVRVREHKGAVLAVAVGVAALTVHLLAGRLAILTASRWLGGIAIGLAVTFVTVLHLEGLRRLVARRGRASNATSQHDDAVEQHHGQAQHDQDRDRAHPEHGHGHGHGHRHAHQDGGGLRGVLGGVFRPHTHDAGDSVVPALAASAAGMRALKISLAGLGATAVIQFLVVLASGSVALLADTIHNAADALTAIPIGIAFIAGRRLANRRYTYGYGRGEDVAGLFVMMDRVDDQAVLAAEQAVRQVPGVVSLDGLRMRWVGHEQLAEVEISADASLLLAQAHGIAEAVRHRLVHQVRRLADATIHVSPQPSAAIDPHRDTSHHFTRTA